MSVRDHHWRRMAGRIGASIEVVMSESGPFASAVDHAQQWLTRVAVVLGEHDRERVWSLTKAVLQTLRDHLTHDEAAHVGAQLPLLFRGAFYEGWRPAETPVRVRNSDEFLGEITAHLHPRRHEDLDVLATFQCVIAALSHCGMGPELEQVRHQLPKAVQEIWDAPVGR
jgi:uncharacterized protein (DUF2267 family)